MKNRCKYLLSVLLFICFFAIFSEEYAFADSGQNIDTAFYSRGLYLCYMDGHMNSVVDTTKSDATVFGDNKKVAGVSSLNNPDDLSCKELFSKAGFEYKTTPQILTSLGYEPYSNMKHMGFDFAGFDQTLKSSDQSVGAITQAINQGARFQKYITVGVNFQVDDDGKVSAATWNIDGQKAQSGLYTIDANGAVDDLIIYSNGNKLKMFKMNYETAMTDFENDEGFIDVTAKGKTPTELADALSSKFKERFIYYNGDLGQKNIEEKDFVVTLSQSGGFGVSTTSKGFYYVNSSNNGKVSDLTSGTTNIYKLNSDKYAAFKKAYKTILKNDFKRTYQNITAEQQAVLYQKYLTDFYKMEIHNSCASTKDKAGEGAGLTVGDENNMKTWRVAKVFGADGNTQYCYVRFDDEDLVKKTVHGVKAAVSGSSLGYSGADGAMSFRLPMMAGERVSLTEILNWMMSSSPDKISAGAIEQYGTTDHSGSDSGGSQGDSAEEVTPTCGNSGGAESLGWIVCPILEWMRKAAEDVYTGAVEPALKVEPKLFTEGGGTEDAWKSFRDMANIAFVILFLMVIFSQVTGVGIDNYGIKKILPKLIIVAVLINLSYLICIICVDLSNIFGAGLKDFLSNLPHGTISSSELSSVEGSGVGATAITGVVLLGLLGAGLFVTWKDPAILIALLVGALGVVVAIFFVFILLAAREAAIIVLTVISPLAVVCYALPNTKKLFDKWMKFWEGLLFLYPICGLLIGGGNFVSKLLLSSGMATNGFWSAFMAMIVGVMPIFFIPTALKGAFAAMGSIGARLTGLGDRMRGGVTKGVRNSRAYQDAQKRSQARSQRISDRRRAGVRIDKDGNVVASKRPTARLRRRMAGTWAGRRLGMEASIGQSTAAFLQQESARRNDIDNSNMDAANVQFTKDANAREQRRAEATVGTARVTQPMAMQRARASREAQALKAFQDQYASLDKGTLRSEAASIASWRGGADGSQRASALISAMESRGMEREIYSMLDSDPSIHTDSAVMATLAGSKNKVLKAFGKTSSTDFTSFMSGTGTGTMQGYIKGKGREFLEGIDDKSLNAIASRNSGAIEDTGLLTEAAASISNAESLAAINDMLRGRNDVSMSANQLAGYGQDTISAIQAGGNIDAILKASDEIAANSKLIGRLNPSSRKLINMIRSARADGGSKTAI